MNKIKSVITCDLEGRIETYNEGAEIIFGYPKEEIIGKKRVSLFSPGHTVLEHVPNWLKIASEEGEYITNTIFLNRVGQPVPAKIRITPTFKNGEQIGYCGVTEVLDGVTTDEIAPHISLKTKLFSWLVITRAPFLTAIILPVLIGATWVAFQGNIAFPAGRFWLALFAGIALHVSANTFNDYFDWRSGTDQANNDYFLPYSGGSRSIELGLISEIALFRVAMTALLVSIGLGLILTYLSGPLILLFGIAGAFSSYFYTAPPLRLASRKGLGELIVGLNFGPLAVAGTVYALTGQIAVEDFLLGIPIGLLTMAILWINQFPDEVGDRAAGKINLVVLLGKRQARWGYILLMTAAFGSLLYWLMTGVYPLGTLLFLGGLPFAVYASSVLIREYDQRSLIRANVATIQLQAVAGFLMALGLLFSAQIGQFFGL